MAAKLSFFFAASAAAQFTTSLWLPQQWLGTDNVRYVASVVGADQDRFTLAATYDNDPDYEALGLATNVTETFTFASTLFDYSTSEILRVAGATSGDYAYRIRCESQTADTAPICTISTGPGMARGQCRAVSYEGYTTTQLWTFSNTETAGVETVMRTFTDSPNTPRPDWCSLATDAPLPSSALISSDQFSSDLFRTYKFIITAGEEKISATTGGVASTSSVAPTGTVPIANVTGNFTSSTAPAEWTGVAAPMRTVAPALTGLGAAIAAFIL